MSAVAEALDAEKRAADGTRIIRRANGVVVTVRPDRVTIIERPDGSRTTVAPGGRVETCLADGTVKIRDPRARIDPATRPLNVWSRSSEEVGRLLSNFARTPFTLDGRAYASVEGFYQGLKVAEPLERARIAKLWGSAAKAAVKGSLTVFDYDGRRYRAGTPEHFALIRRAIAAKLDQHPGLAAAFKATHPRPIRHDTGRPDGPNAVFPAAVLVAILTDLRDGLVAAAE